MAKDKKSSGDVRFIKPPNILKQKVGKGGIDEATIKKAQRYIDTAELDFRPYAEKFLKELSGYAKEARKSNDNFQGVKEQMIGPIMQLKANGGMFQYQLVSDIADIALQFLESIEGVNDDAFDVLRAHENTIKIIVTNELRGDGGNEGYALVKELDKACKRYFSKYKT